METTQNVFTKTTAELHTNVFALTVPAAGKLLVAHCDLVVFTSHFLCGNCQEKHKIEFFVPFCLN